MTAPTTSSETTAVAGLPGVTTLNALLGGEKWGGAQGTGATLSYSFPWVAGGAVFAGYNGQPYSTLREDLATYHYGLNAEEMAAVRGALAAWSNVANLTFVETTETTTNVGDLRIAWTSAVQVVGGENAWGWAGFPGEFWPSSGDVWISTESSAIDNDDWSAGSYNYGALVHELGHALGLKHPFEDGAVLPAWQDNRQYTVMSYEDSAHSLYLDVYPVAVGVQALFYAITPRTPMVLDIAAIQYIYGANMSYRAGDDTYTFDSVTPFFETIWDAGGNDTISVANFTRACVIDLEAGQYSSISIPSDTGEGYTWSTPLPTPTYDGTDNLGIAFGCTIENATGGSGADTLIGNEVANRLQGNGGNDTVDGAGGTDSLAYSASLSSHRVTYANGTVTVVDKTGAAGTDTAVNVEKVVFSDRTIDLGVRTAAANVSAATVTKVVELYIAFFNRVPDSEGMAYWLGQVAAGVPVTSVADSFYQAALLYSSITGYSANMTNADFVRIIYSNVLGRSGATAPPDEDVNYWAARLAAGTDTRGSLVDTMLGSAHTFKGNATYGWVADLLDNKAVVGKLFAVDMALSFNTPEQSISQGMAIAAAITPTSTSAAVALIGVQAADIQLA